MEIGYIIVGCITLVAVAHIFRQGAVNAAKVGYYEEKLRNRLNQFTPDEQKEFSQAMEVRSFRQLRKWLKK